MEWKWTKADHMGLAHFITDDANLYLDKLPENRLNLLLRDDNGRRKLVETIYETLITRNIRYAHEKYQPEDALQIIRAPEQILTSPGEGTCLDLALLFCSLCHSYDLFPLIIVTDKHAFAAVSLKFDGEHQGLYDKERTIFEPSEVFRDKVKLQEWVNGNAYIAVECTGFAHTKCFDNIDAPEAIGRTKEGVLPFDRAVAAGQEQLNKIGLESMFAIDIATAMYNWRIQPEARPINPSEDRDVLKAGEKLSMGQKLVSKNKRFKLVLQSDGNLVWYDKKIPESAFSLNGKSANGSFHVDMQYDDNFVLYDDKRNVYWCSNTFRKGDGDCQLRVEDDGKVAIYTSENKIIWTKG
jgi:hypothetical protein